MKAVKVEVLKRGRERTSLSVVLDEGQNRQIRRMLAKLGHKVKTLRRERLGPLTLGDLKPGQSRLLTPPEVKAIRNAARPRQAPGQARRRMSVGGGPATLTCLHERARPGS